VTLVKAVGINNIHVLDPFDLETSRKVLKNELEKEEPSVIIFRRPCALLDKSKSLPLRIVPEKCKNCGLCLRIGCPAIQKLDEGMVIDDALCNGCGLCERICRFNAMERVDL
jgi:indolepyruvate ferredoxin oxidoreductase alpha subunit